MKPETKQTLIDLLITTVVSAVVVTLFSAYKHKLPESIAKHFKE